MSGTRTASRRPQGKCPALLWEDRCCPARIAGVAKAPDTDHAHLRRPWPAVALVPDGFGCAPHKLPCRGGCRGPTSCPHQWTGVRETTGYCPRRQIVVDTGMAIDASLATGAGQQPSGERSLERPLRKQRTVNPPMVPARYNFLHASSRPACGRPPAAAGNDATVTGELASPSARGD
jgi:hypothetical protein